MLAFSLSVLICSQLSPPAPQRSVLVGEENSLPASNDLRNNGPLSAANPPSFSQPAGNPPLSPPPARFAPINAAPLTQSSEDASQEAELDREDFRSVNDSSSAPLTQVVPASGISLGGANENIQLTAASQPANDPQKLAAEQMFRHLLFPTSGQQLDGSSVSLATLLQGSSDRATQGRIAKNYWLLCVAVSEYHAALYEADTLSRVQASGQPHEDALLTSARLAAQARQTEARLAAIATQYELAEMTGGLELALPKDAPLFGAYRTNFDHLFQQNNVPLGLKRIDRTLPGFLEVLYQRTESVDAAEEAMQTVLAAYQNRRAPLSDVLYAEEFLRKQRRQFLVAVRDYNFTVADYALAVATQGMSSEQLAAMLIARPAPAESPRLIAPASTSSISPAPVVTPAAPVVAPAAVSPAVPAPFTPAGATPRVVVPNIQNPPAATRVIQQPAPVIQSPTPAPVVVPGSPGEGGSFPVTRPQ